MVAVVTNNKNLFFLAANHKLEQQDVNKQVKYIPSIFFLDIVKAFVCTLKAIKLILESDRSFQNRSKFYKMEPRKGK